MLEQDNELGGVSGGELVGDVLRHQREALKLDLDDISTKLRIRKEHLEAIETNQLKALPAEAYAIGFIRTYANHLGLDEAVLVSNFKMQLNGGTRVSFNFPDLEEKREIPGMALAIGLMVLVLLAYMFIAFLNNAQIITGEKGKETFQAVQSELRQAESEPRGTVPDVKNDANETSEANETSKTSEKITELATKQKQPVADALPDLPQTPSAGEDNTLPTPPKKLEATPLSPVFSIRARGETWMRIVSEEGRILFSSIILEGETFAFPKGEKFRLATQNAGRLEYVIDGKAVGLVGARGQTLSNRQINMPRLLEKFALYP